MHIRRIFKGGTIFVNGNRPDRQKNVAPVPRLCLKSNLGRG